MRRAVTPMASAPPSAPAMNSRVMGAGSRAMTATEARLMTAAAAKQHFSMARTRLYFWAPQL